MPSENLRSMAVGMKRLDGRAADELRPVRIDAGVQGYAEGSALIEAGETRVLCAVSVEETVPRWLRGSGRGWVTAEYAMLPRSTLTRTPRERNAGGRSREIQRLIGRSLRAVVDLDALGQRMFTGGLRRTAGRRRHAHGGGNRGIRGRCTRRPAIWSRPASSSACRFERGLRL